MTGSKSNSRRMKYFIGLMVLIVVGITGRFLMQRPVLHEADLFLPIECTQTTRSVTVISPRSAGLDVRVKGPGKSIERLSQIPLKYQFQVTEPKDGVQTIPVDFSRIELPADLSIIHSHPKMITVRIERLVEKKLPVVVVLTGLPPPNFSIFDSVIQPDSVQVTGPERIISSLTRIPMKPVDISGISKSVHQSVVLDLPDGIKSVQSEEFVIDVTIKEKMITRQIDSVEIQGAGAGGPYRITPAAITVTVSGPVHLIDNLEENPDFDIYVDLHELDPGVHVRRAVILLPLETTLVKATPEIFTVHIGVPNKNGG